MPQRQPDKEKNRMGMTAGCAKTAARLSAYLDGGMDAAERDGMNRHFTDCASCRAELAQQRQAESALTAARFALPPVGDLRPAFYARLQTENASRLKRPAINWRLAVPALASAALAAVLWRPGADVPMKRSETAPSLSISPLPAPRSIAKVAPQNLAKAEPTRRETSPATAKLKTAPRVSDNSVLRVSEAPVFAKKAPKMPAPLSTPPPQVTRNRALAPAAAQTASAKDTLRVVALTEEGDRLKPPYGMQFSFDGAPPQSALRREEAFYFDGLPTNADALKIELKRDERTVKSDEALALQAPQFSASLAEGPGVLTLSAAPGLPTMYADAAPGSPASAAAPVTVQIAAAATQNVERAKAETSARDEVDFEVRDEERGFTSRMKVTDSLEAQQDGETLTIEAEADNGS